MCGQNSIPYTHIHLAYEMKRLSHVCDTGCSCLSVQQGFAAMKMRVFPQLGLMTDAC